MMNQILPDLSGRTRYQVESRGISLSSVHCSGKYCYSRYHAHLYLPLLLYAFMLAALYTVLPNVPKLKSSICVVLTLRVPEHAGV